MRYATFKRVFRTTADEGSINARIVEEWDKGGALVDISVPAGMATAFLTFAYPAVDAA